MAVLLLATSCVTTESSYRSHRCCCDEYDPQGYKRYIKNEDLPRYKRHPHHRGGRR